MTSVWVVIDRGGAVPLVYSIAEYAALPTAAIMSRRARLVTRREAVRLRAEALGRRPRLRVTEGRR
jgi:hypothetical protein